MRVQQAIMIVLAASLLAGCGAERPQFSSREELDELAPEAAEHVRQTLASRFGTSPVDMIAWERLPIQYSVAKGTLAANEASVADGKPGAALTLEISGENRPIEPGQMVAFTSGAYAGAVENGTIDTFDAATGGVTILEDGYQTTPAVGDRVVIGPGLILEEGRKLYAEHCQHCHGVTGDGNGPTAIYLNPRPRDYRLGKFKFTSTNTSDRASREDLRTTIWEGIPGTYMPSFKLLTETEMQSIVEYVLWLSMRGEIEYRQVQTFKNDFSREAIDAAVADARESDESLSNSDARAQVIEELTAYLTEDWPDEFNDDTKFLAEQWQNGQLESAIVYPKTARVADTPESRAEGRRLYLDAKAKCATCHGVQGLGDGGQTLSVQKNALTNTDYDLPGLYDDWGNPLQPRNLTKGIYRGGRRPIDLYRRIYAGIKGTPMPAFGTVLKDEEIWHIVNYVLSIPFDARERKPGQGAGETIPAPAEVAANESAVTTATTPTDQPN